MQEKLDQMKIENMKLQQIIEEKKWENSLEKSDFKEILQILERKIERKMKVQIAEARFSLENSYRKKQLEEDEKLKKVTKQKNSIMN